MTIRCRFAVLSAMTLGISALGPSGANAQWWTAAPADYEECAERAGRSAKDKATLLAACDDQFAGRRKPGGGYTYYDFMQNRSFDIAGPNPTPAELKAIDEHYASYLDQHRRSVIAAAFAEKQREQQQAALQPPSPPPVITAAPAKDSKPVALPRPRPRIKPPDCADPLSCGLSKLSSGLSDIKKALFGPPPKARRTREG
jgi:hypothetical protein